MSCVDNYILKANFSPAVVTRLIEPLNAWLQQEHHQGEAAFVRVDKHAGGRKYLEMSVWLAALNYVQWSEVEGKIRELAAHPYLRYFEESLLEVFVLVQAQAARPDHLYGRLQPLRIYGDNREVLPVDE